MSSFLEVWTHYSIYVVWLVAIICWFAGFEVGVVAVCSAALGLLCVSYSDNAADITDRPNGDGDTIMHTMHNLLDASVEHPVFYYILFVFPTVSGFVMTGVPGAFWVLIEPYCSTNSADHPAELALLVFVVVVYVQVVTNVPAAMLLGNNIARLAVKEGFSSTRGYVLCSFVCCVAGGLTINGSITQLAAYGATKVRTNGRVSVSNLQYFLVAAPAVFGALAVGVPIVLSLAY